MTGSLIVALLTVLAWPISFAHSYLEKKEDHPVAQGLPSLRAHLRQVGVDDILFPVEHDGRITLMGYFSDDRKKQAFKASVDKMLPSLKVYPLILQTEAELLRRIREQLLPDAPMVYPVMNGLGRVQLTGILPPTFSAKMLIERLHAHFSAQLLEMNARVLNVRDTERFLQKLIDHPPVDKSVLPLLSLKLTPGSILSDTTNQPSRPIVLTESLPDKTWPVKNIEDVRAELAKMASRNHVLLDIDVMSPRERSMRLVEHAVTHIANAPVRFVRLRNGETVFEEGKIAGVAIKKIDKQYVYLNDGDVLSAV